MSAWRPWVPLAGCNGGTRHSQLRADLRRVLGIIKGRLLGSFERRSYSQEGEDMILRRLFDSCRSGFYIDVGAHHPLRFSNTYFFYRLGWSGINIEPNPDFALAFRLFRPRDEHVQEGVAESPGTLTYFRFDDAALNTFDRGLARQREEAAGRARLPPLEVKVERLDAILERLLPPETAIDFLSVDVEGMDLAVLRSNDWGRFRPKCVLVEALAQPSVARLMASELARFLEDRGYRFFAKSFNSAFFVDSQWQRPG